MRRKDLTFNLILLLSALIGLYGCQDELSESARFLGTNREKAILEAQTLYAKQAPGMVHTRAIKDGPQIRVKPEWTHANVASNADFLTVEVALLSEYYFIFMYPEARELLMKTKDARYKTSQTRFVFLTDKKSGSTEMFLMSIVPHPVYLEKTGFKPYRKITYLSRGDPFSGMILYHNLEGEFVNGYQYEEGTITHTISACEREEEAELPIVTTRSSCYDYYLEYLVEVCGSWEVNGEYGGTECYSYTEWQYWYTSCSGGGGGDGGYGGGGGGNSGGEGSSWTGAYRITKKITASNKSVIQKMLDEKFDDILLMCAGQFIYKEMHRASRRFSDVIVKDMDYQAGYDPRTEELILSYPGDITTNTLFEEYIHMYQDERYNGSSKYLNEGKPNIEFEARLIQDLARLYTNLGSPNFPKYPVEYERWLEALTSDGTKSVTLKEIMETKYQGLGYWDFMEALQQSHPSYNKPIIDGLEPRALAEVIGNFTGC